MPVRLRTLLILLLALLLPVRMFAGIAPESGCEPHSQTMTCCADPQNAHPDSGGVQPGVCDHGICCLGCALPLPPNISALPTPVCQSWPPSIADAVSARIPDLPHPPPRSANV